MQHAGHKCPSPVDGVDHPGQTITRPKTVFLSEDSVLGVGAFNGRTNDAFGRLIRSGNRIKATVIPFVRDLYAGAKIRQHLSSRRPNGLLGKGQKLLALLSRNIHCCREFKGGRHGYLLGEAT